MNTIISIFQESEAVDSVHLKSISVGNVPCTLSDRTKTPEEGFRVQRGVKVNMGLLQ